MPSQPYPHHHHLPFAHQPLKAIYVFQRLFTTLALVPYWAIYYTVLPKSSRPRESWSLRQIVNVKFTRRIYKITEVAGVTWGTRDPQSEPNKKRLKETRFEWAEPLPEHLRAGILVGDSEFTRVGCYVWPKVPPEHYKQPGSSADDIPIIGIFMHGGGYCHMSAHESAQTSRIPRRLVKDKIMTEIYSVEYRLLQHASFPAAIQDAATIYAHIIARFHSSPCKIILIGDSSGGNLVLALTRWLRDEATLPMPSGLLLLSPSCDVSHALPPSFSSPFYTPRPNASTDYLPDTPEPRALLQRTFLGFQPLSPESSDFSRLMEIAHSEYVSPCSPRVLREWKHPVTVPLPVPFSDSPSDQDHDQDTKAPPTPTSTSTSTPHPKSKFTKLFQHFPRTLLIAGDAERLVLEVQSLQDAMLRDDVDLTAEWVSDAVHDVLIIKDGWWDRDAVRKAWTVVGEWCQAFRTC